MIPTPHTADPGRGLTIGYPILCRGADRAHGTLRQRMGGAIPFSWGDAPERHDFPPGSRAPSGTKLVYFLARSAHK